MKQPDSAPPIHRYLIVLASVFIFTATMMSFVNSVHAEFVNWDDDVYVVNNPLVQNLSADNIESMFTQSHYYAWIPLTLLSHAADFSIWQWNAKGHHLTNVVLHAVNATLLFLVCLLLFDASQTADDVRPLFYRLAPSIVVGSAIGAMLFAMHPQRVESVAWVSGRKDLLCAFFLIPSVGAYVRWRMSGLGRWRWISVTLFALALMAKPAAAPLPLVLLAVDVWLSRNESLRRLSLTKSLANKAPYFALSIIVGVITMLAASGGTVNVLVELNRIERILLPLYALCFYVWKLIVPLDLIPIYPELERWLLYVSPLVIAATAYGCFVLWKKQRRGVVSALLCYALMVLPTMLGLRTGMQPLADRYSYLSTLSLFVLTGGSIEWLWRMSAVSRGKLFQREMFAVLLLAICAVSSYRTIRHTGVWKNSIEVWTQVLRYAPKTKEEHDTRKPYMKPTFLDARINLGGAYYTAGNKDKAWENFSAVLTLDSCNADAHYNLGVLLVEEGDGANAERAFTNAIACDPSYAKAFHNLGVLSATRDSIKSLTLFRTAARLGFSDSQVLLRKRGVPW
jgi:hypothetical protein